VSDAKVAEEVWVVRVNRPTRLAAAFFCGVATSAVAALIAWKLLVRQPAGLYAGQAWPWMTSTLVAIAIASIVFTFVLAVLDRLVDRDSSPPATNTTGAG
jgi:hypothetical protein